jgi:hypothetical protein
MRERILLDRDFGDAELLDRPGVAHKMSGRPRHGKMRMSCDGERRQHLIGKVQLESRTRGMVLAQGSDGLLGDGFRRLAAAPIGGEGCWNALIVGQ